MDMQNTTSTTTLQATPAKLRSGDWGAKTRGSQSAGISKGDTCTLLITTKSGKSWTADHKCIWTGSDGTALWAKVENRPARYSQPRYSSGRYYAGSLCDREHDNYVDAGQQCPGCKAWN